MLQNRHNHISTVNLKPTCKNIENSQTFFNYSFGLRGSLLSSSFNSSAALKSSSDTTISSFLYFHHISIIFIGLFLYLNQHTRNIRNNSDTELFIKKRFRRHTFNLCFHNHHVETFLRQHRRVCSIVNDVLRTQQTVLISFCNLVL